MALLPPGSFLHCITNCFLLPIVLPLLILQHYIWLRGAKSWLSSCNEFFANLLPVNTSYSYILWQPSSSQYLIPFFLSISCYLRHSQLLPTASIFPYSSSRRWRSLIIYFYFDSSMPLYMAYHICPQTPLQESRRWCSISYYLLCRRHLIPALAGPCYSMVVTCILISINWLMRFYLSVYYVKRKEPFY